MTGTDTTPTERSMLPAQGSMEAFERLRTDMMDVAENFWRGAPLPWMSTPAWPLANGWGPMNPPVDMSETDDAYVVTAELPGMKKDDVVVEADNQLLTISGSKEDEHKSVRKHHQYAERRYGAFKRILTLPRDADVEAVDAVFKNGVLTVTLPKRADVAAGRKVPVK